MHYIIYKTTNNINGKYYIGQHITDNLEDGYLGSGVALNRAIKKYGRENFTREILATATNEEMLNDLEAVYVTWKEVDDENCYNLMTGGGASGLRSKETRKKMSAAKKGNTNMLGKTQSVDTRKKIGESNKARRHSPETKQKISVAKKGRPGKKHSPESRQKMREAKKNVSLETRKKLSQATSGKTHSPETKQKISEGLKRYLQAKMSSPHTIS